MPVYEQTKEDQFDISVGSNYVDFVDLPHPPSSGIVIGPMLSEFGPSNSDIPGLDMREKAIYERHATSKNTYGRYPVYSASYSDVSSGGADDAMLMEMNILKQKNEQFLEIIQQQSQRIQELEAQLKERGTV